MRIEIDPASPVPIYLQIVEQVRRLVALGALRNGDRLPTVRELAVQCRINRNTAGRAIQELEREGIVRTQVGQGTFVAEVISEIDPVERDSVLDSQIDRLLVEARSLGVPLEQLSARLWRRIESFREARAASGPLTGSAAAENRGLNVAAAGGSSLGERTDSAGVENRAAGVQAGGGSNVGERTRRHVGDRAKTQGTPRTEPSAPGTGTAVPIPSRGEQADVHGTAVTSTDVLPEAGRTDTGESHPLDEGQGEEGER
jgi:GntR family transcriptional regulator